MVWREREARTERAKSARAVRQSPFRSIKYRFRFPRINLIELTQTPDVVVQNIVQRGMTVASCGLTRWPFAVCQTKSTNRVEPSEYTEETIVYNI